MAPTIHSWLLYGFVFRSEDNRFNNLHESFMGTDRGVILFRVEENVYVVAIRESIRGLWFSIKRPMGTTRINIPQYSEEWFGLLEEFVQFWSKAGAQFPSQRYYSWRLVTLNSYFAEGCDIGEYYDGKIEE